jgi:hypothetical protein
VVQDDAVLRRHLLVEEALVPALHLAQDEAHLLTRTRDGHAER